MTYYNGGCSKHQMSIPCPYCEIDGLKTELHKARSDLGIAKNEATLARGEYERGRREGQQQLINAIVERIYDVPASVYGEPSAGDYAKVVREFQEGAHPTADKATSDAIAEAMERSRPLVRDALKLGRSITGTDPTVRVVGADKATTPATCATCGNCGIKTTPRCNVCPPAKQARCDDPMCQMNDTHEKCPDCGGGSGERR
jgi:hypothetical protein